MTAHDFAARDGRAAEPSPGAGEAPQPTGRRPPSMAPVPPGHPQRDATIMLVDDDPSIIDLVRLYLEDAGYRRFLTTTDSARATALLREGRPDVVLLDLLMPEVSGFDILAERERDPGTAHVPVIVLTSSTDAATKLRALELGANDFLAKPVDPSELALRVRNMLAVKAYQDQIEQERHKADRLLLGILPEPVAARLKLGERNIAEHFEEATVLFADLVGFTDFASRTDPTSVVARLNEVFETFDELVEARGLEKVKTIGDAYMLVGGLPTPRPDHADAVVDAALAMLVSIDALRGRRAERLSIRIGVHSGPVVAGVIGRSRFSYDLWGDTVNVASRMESHGIPGHVQISEATRAALGGAFRIQPRGAIAIKGKGAMRTYLVRGRRHA